MITIVATFKLKHNNIEAFKAVIKPLITQTLLEPGNISYELYVSRTDKSVFTLIEVWQDEAAIDLHNNTEHFLTYVPQLVNLCAEAPSITQYEKV